MRPYLDHVSRHILPVCLACLSMCHAAERPVPNELNSAVEEPLVTLPEVETASPFRSASKRRNLGPSMSQDTMVRLVEDAISSTRRRLLSTEINTPWQVMHGLLALRSEFDIRQKGEIVSGLDWVSSGPVFEGEPWFEKTPYGGRAHPYSRPWAFEGHANQFLAILSMSALPLNHQFQTPTGPITIADMLEHAQKTVSSKDEPTWTLWALSRYLPPDASWRTTYGETWSIERLVTVQTAKPLQGTACGGTHGMFALAHARNVYLRTGKPLRGVWLEAEYKIRRLIKTARVQQNSNGMLSSNYFRGREYKRDFNKRLASAGHILEFLMMALPQDQLQEDWVRRAIHTTAEDLLQNRKSEVRCSPLYHAVNGLNIFLDRVRPQRPPEVASTRETEDDLKPLDDTNSESLKSIPATRISEARPLLPEVGLSIPSGTAVPKPAEKKDAQTAPADVDDVASASATVATAVGDSASSEERREEPSKTGESRSRTNESQQEQPEKNEDEAVNSRDDDLPEESPSSQKSEQADDEPENVDGS